MIAEISAGFSSLSAAKDLLQAFNGVQTATADNDVKLTLQGHLFDARDALQAAKDALAMANQRISELENEIVRMENWEGEKERYQLKRYNPGTLAYAIKPAMAGGEPPHNLCANCYQQHKKSILQAAAEINMRYRVHYCPSCKNKVEMGSEVT